MLVVAVELCSLTLIPQDRSPTNLVSASLFGDGAAALVLAPEGEGPTVLGGFCHLFDESEDLVFWDVVPEGLRVRLGRRIPRVVQERVRPVIEAGLSRYGIPADEQVVHALHPGGAKVLGAYEAALGIEAGALEDARGVLRDYGNMSSPTVLFILERMLQQTAREESAVAVLLAPGPGFSAEGVLLQQ